MSCSAFRTNICRNQGFLFTLMTSGKNLLPHQIYPVGKPDNGETNIDKNHDQQQNGNIKKTCHSRNNRAEYKYRKHRQYIQNDKEDRFLPSNKFGILYFFFKSTDGVKIPFPRTFNSISYISIAFSKKITFFAGCGVDAISFLPPQLISLRCCKNSPIAVNNIFLK